MEERFWLEIPILELAACRRDEFTKERRQETKETHLSRVWS